MNVSAIGNLFAARPETAGTLAMNKPVETAGVLAFGGAEILGYGIIGKDFIRKKNWQLLTSGWK